MSRETIEKAGRYCESAMKHEAEAADAHAFDEAARWAEIGSVWSAIAFEESARGAA